MFSEKVNKALKEKGISKVWLAFMLGIQRTSLSTKIKNNTFSKSDVFYISHLLRIEEDSK